MMYITFVVLATIHSILCLDPHRVIHQVENGTTCNDPGIPQHAQREEKMSKFNVGMTISFHCDEKYTLIGERNRTCLPNGTWSNSQPFCKKYMCDKNDVLHPRNGKRIGNDFTIGSEIKFRCSSLYTLIGSNVITCLFNGTWSNKAPKCKHRCQQKQCDIGMICKIRNHQAVCLCRQDHECSSIWSPVCGNDGKTYNNKCLMKASGCRSGRQLRVVANTGCLPGDRCNIIPVSNCRAAFDVFYYNVKTGNCQNMIAGGCHPSGWNGFNHKTDCTNYCKKDVCALPPDRGPCDGNIKRLYFDSEKKSCQIFEYGGCFGNANNFQSFQDCKKRCA
ncbi:papilin-like isoform X2 [Xenia sp. Carnegie-2017]|nr:papilin-like isoform X2 [Xenia sp. Carnegie-2017]